MLAESLLVPLWAFVCFYDQRESLNTQLHEFWDTPTDAASASADTTGSQATDSATATVPHGSRLADVLLQLDVHKTVGYYVFLFALAFCVAALVEEAVKLWVVAGTGCRCTCRCAKSKPTSSLKPTPSGGPCDPSRLLFQHPRHSSHAIVVFMGVTAAALGFAVFENVGYVLGTAAGRDRVVAALLRTSVSAPLHSICGGITGVRLAQQLQRRRRGTVSVGSVASATNETKRTAAQDLAQWRTKLTVLAPSIGVHGAFDLYVLLVASLVTDEMVAAHPTKYGVVVPAVGVGVILVGAFVFLRQSLHAMEHQMNAGRYIQVAVDLESGRRVGVSYSDSDSDSGDDAFGDSGGAYDAGRGGTGAPRKTRSVFNV